MSLAVGSLDTNVLLRFLLGDVEEQAKDATQLLELTHGQYHVSDAAIVELAFVLERHYHFARPAVRQSVETLLLLPHLSMNRSLFDKVLPQYVAHPSLSFEDCCLVTYATLNDAEPLWTFDRKLARQAPSARLVPSAKRSRTSTR